MNERDMSSASCRACTSSSNLCRSGIAAEFRKAAEEIQVTGILGTLQRVDADIATAHIITGPADDLLPFPKLARPVIFAGVRAACEFDDGCLLPMQLINIEPAATD